VSDRTDVIAEWAGRLRPTFPVELRALPGATPAMTMTTRPVGAIPVTWFAAAGVQTVRTTQHIALHDPQVLVVHLVTVGSPVVAGAERPARLGPGDLTVVSSGRPYQMTQQDRHEGVSFSIPRALLEPHAGRLDAIALQRCADPVAHRLVAPALARIAEAARSGDVGHADADYGELVVSLARTLAAPRHGAQEADAAGGSRGVVLLRQAKAYIEERLQDPDLRPAEVAQAQFISVRYLQKLFQAEGVTMLEWTRRARLRRARRDLADPSLGHRTIAAIATSWGFRHPGHFRRAFRAEFGVTPTSFRRSMLGAPSWSTDCGASGAAYPNG
jgi:AraC-like DNA-binding protein